MSDRYLKDVEQAPYVADVATPHEQGLEQAAKFIDQRIADYVQEHGVTDSETGTVEFPGWGDEYVSELEELAEAIRALAPASADQDRKRKYVDCPCTTVQQDETCPVGYPSLLCEICDGKGVVPVSSHRETALEKAARKAQKAIATILASGGLESDKWWDDLVSAQQSLAAAIRALAPASAEVADDWQPIETTLKDFRKFIDLIEGRAMACDGPVTPFLEELGSSSDSDKQRFTEILGRLYRLTLPAAPNGGP